MSPRVIIWNNGAVPLSGMPWPLPGINEIGIMNEERLYDFIIAKKAGYFIPHVSGYSKVYYLDEDTQGLRNDIRRRHEESSIDR